MLYKSEFVSSSIVFAVFEEDILNLSHCLYPIQLSGREDFLR
jgi:hypothetical protein